MIDANLIAIRPATLPPAVGVTRARFDRACARLDRFMLRTADRLAGLVGFGYEESDSAPYSFVGVMCEFLECRETRRPFRVWSGASGSCVYTPAGNWAFRYWHDVSHALMQADFSGKGERAVSLAQLAEVCREFGASSVEADIFRADTLGQLEYRERTDRFVTNQREFAFDFVNGGLCLAGSREDARNDAPAEA